MKKIIHKDLSIFILLFCFVPIVCMPFFLMWVFYQPEEWIKFLIILFIVFFCAISCLKAFVVAVRDIRCLEDIPTAKIRSVPQGYAELNGIAQQVEGTKLPISERGEECLWYRSWYEDDKGRKVALKESKNCFYLVDDTGRCLVDPKDMEFSDKEVINGERLIKPGDKLHILGFFKTIRGNAAIDKLINEWMHDRRLNLYKYDANNDGQLDKEEWLRVKQAAIQLLTAHETEIRQHAELNLIEKPDNEKQSFIVSINCELNLIRTLKGKAFKHFIWFIIFFVVIALMLKTYY